jgi:protein gp37
MAERHILQIHIIQILSKRHERLAKLADVLRWPDNVWVGVGI